MMFAIKFILNFLQDVGNAIFFLFDILKRVFSRQVRLQDVLTQIYEQGIQSILIITLTSLATGAVLALQSYVALARFGAKDYVASLVGLSLVRELGPVFTSLIFSGKAGARMTADLGTMNVNDQILATRTLGVDPIAFLVAPRMLAAFFVLPVLVVLSEIIGIFGGYLIGVHEAHIPSTYYLNQTLKAIGYVDFFSGFIKTFFFAIIISWTCCYQGFFTKGGSLGVGRYTTKAVAFSYIFIVMSNTVLTKIILTIWG